MVEPSEVGIRPCINCRWLFVSDDVERIRRCQRCKRLEKNTGEPRSATVHLEGIEQKGRHE